MHSVTTVNVNKLRRDSMKYYEVKIDKFELNNSNENESLICCIVGGNKTPD